MVVLIKATLAQPFSDLVNFTDTSPGDNVLLSPKEYIYTHPSNGGEGNEVLFNYCFEDFELGVTGPL